jgi:DNA-directed RNA polymerase specialized sigma24 family protein
MQYDDTFTGLFLEMIEPYIKTFSYQYKIPGLYSDDIAQELRFFVWRKIDKYNPMLSSPKTWSVRVMKNRIYDLSNPKKYKKDMIIDKTVSIHDLEV